MKYIFYDGNEHHSFHLEQPNTQNEMQKKLFEFVDFINKKISSAEKKLDRIASSSTANVKDMKEKMLKKLTELKNDVNKLKEKANDKMEMKSEDYKKMISQLEEKSNEVTDEIDSFVRNTLDNIKNKM